MMNVVDYLSVPWIFMIGLLFWYSVTAIGLELWNRWFARPRQIPIQHREGVRDRCSGAASGESRGAEIRRSARGITS